MADAVWKIWRLPWRQEPNDQGPMGCDAVSEDFRFWEGVSCSIHSLGYSDVWQQPAGIPLPRGLSHEPRAMGRYSVERILPKSEF